jgi:hypothetical protein
MELLSGTAMQELDDEGLGWFSRRLPWGSYGMLARASLSAPNLGVALKRWCRHHGTDHRRHRADAANVKIPRPPRAHEQHDLGPLREFCLVSCCATSTAWPAG